MADYFPPLHSPCTDQVLISNTLSVTSPDHFLDDHILEEEVFYATKPFKRNKAPGLDGMAPELFKTFRGQLIAFLTKIISYGLQKCSFP